MIVGIKGVELIKSFFKAMTYPPINSNSIVLIENANMAKNLFPTWWIVKIIMKYPMFCVTAKIT